MPSILAKAPVRCGARSLVQRQVTQALPITILSVSVGRRRETRSSRASPHLPDWRLPPPSKAARPSPHKSRCFSCRAAESIGTRCSINAVGESSLRRRWKGRTPGSWDARRDPWTQDQRFSCLLMSSLIACVILKRILFAFAGVTLRPRAREVPPRTRGSGAGPGKEDELHNRAPSSIAIGTVSRIAPRMTSGYGSTTFGSSAALAGPWLCVPALQLVCLCRVIVGSGGNIPALGAKANRAPRKMLGKFTSALLVRRCRLLKLC